MINRILSQIINLILDDQNQNQVNLTPPNVPYTDNFAQVSDNVIELDVATVDQTYSLVHDPIDFLLIATDQSIGFRQASTDTMWQIYAGGFLLINGPVSSLLLSNLAGTLLGANAGPFNIPGSSNLYVTVGNTNYTIPLTTGATRTALQVVDDINTVIPGFASVFANQQILLKAANFTILTGTGDASSVLGFTVGTSVTTSTSNVANPRIVQGSRN